MSELENLTKSLNSIVNNLLQIVARGNTANNLLQPEPPKIKKSSDMTYQQFLEKVLAGKEPLTVPVKKMSYRIQEDIEMLLALANASQITQKTFEEIASGKRINRTLESLKSRYNEHLHKIGERQMKKIVSWIEKEGLEGFLYFEDNDLKISLSDPKERQAEKKRERPASLEAEGKRIEKVEKKGGKIRAVPTNCKQLNQVLRIYSKMVNYPIKTLLQLLDRLSGDFTQLDTYIQTKDSRMLWTADEDQILKKGGLELQIIKRYRGEGVEVRRKYLGLA